MVTREKQAAVRDAYGRTPWPVDLCGAKGCSHAYQQHLDGVALHLFIPESTAQEIEMAGANRPSVRDMRRVAS